jgi:hypothetical protein
MANPFTVAADLLDPPDLDLVRSAEDLGVFLWSKQQEIVRSVQHNRRTAVKSCHDSGKSFTAAVVAGLWIKSHLPGDAFVISTAPRWPQVRMILWREINRLHSKYDLPGTVNQTEWWIGGEAVGFGRKPSDYDDTGFQGIHAPYPLVIVDEAGGIPASLWTSVEAVLTNEDARILAIGNPDVSGTPFEEMFAPGSQWETITIRAEDTPNFTGEVVPDNVARSLLSRRWVEDQRVAWGEDDPRWIAKVMAEFPKDHADGVVPWSALNACMEVKDDDPTPADYPDLFAPVALGVDVGGGGDDTVVRERRGIRAGREWAAKTPDSEQAAVLVLKALRETGATVVNIDSIGVGFGIVGLVRSGIRQDDTLRHAGIVVNPVNVAESPTTPEARKRFDKLRDELWWVIGRELAVARGYLLDSMEAKDETVRELIAPKWSLNLAGKIKVEAKDETKKRIGRSPDHADAFLLAFYTAQAESKEVIGY